MYPLFNQTIKLFNFRKSWNQIKEGRAVKRSGKKFYYYMIKLQIIYYIAFIMKSIT